MNVQQQEQAAFEQAFAADEGEAPISTAAPQEAVAETPAEPQPSETQAQEAPTPEEPAEPEAKPEGEPSPESDPAQDDDPVILDGLKRSELHRLLANAADVENLKRQLDKAHGNIGELNRKLQQVSQPAPAAAPAQAPELPPELKRFEEEYPEVAQYVKALGLMQQPKTSETPAEPAQPAPAEPAQTQSVVDPMDLELLVMDRMHEGWREKIGSAEFQTWRAAQPLAVQTDIDRANTAAELSGVLRKFEDWATARSAAAEKVARGQQRLQKAVTPTGAAQRPQEALTEEEAFAAALKS